MQPIKKRWWQRQTKTDRRLEFLESRCQLMEEHIQRLYQNDKYLERCVDSVKMQLPKTH